MGLGRSYGLPRTLGSNGGSKEAYVEHRASGHYA